MGEGEKELAVSLVQQLVERRFREWLDSREVVSSYEETRSAFDAGLALGFEVANMGSGGGLRRTVDGMGQPKR